MAKFGDYTLVNKPKLSMNGSDNMILKPNDVLQKGDVIHYAGGTTIIIRGGFIGKTAQDVMGDNPEAYDHFERLDAVVERDRWERAYIRLFEINEQRIAQLELYERAIAMYERKVVEQARELEVFRSMRGYSNKVLEQSAEIGRLRAVIRRSTTPDRTIDTAPWDEQ
jgi:hypothetical protein